jgi:hypothetical protein
LILIVFETKKHQEIKMTTFWLIFMDPHAPLDKRFLGVAIFDMDETDEKVSIGEIVSRAGELGINPGGAVFVSSVPFIPEEHKNKLITDDSLLIKLGSSGRNKANLN